MDKVFFLLLYVLALAAVTNWVYVWSFRIPLFFYIFGLDLHVQVFFLGQFRFNLLILSPILGQSQSYLTGTDGTITISTVYRR